MAVMSHYLQTMHIRGLPQYPTALKWEVLHALMLRVPTRMASLLNERAKDSNAGLTGCQYLACSCIPQQVFDPSWQGLACYAHHVKRARPAADLGKVHQEDEITRRCNCSNITQGTHRKFCDTPAFQHT